MQARMVTRGAALALLVMAQLRRAGCGTPAGSGGPPKVYQPPTPIDVEVDTSPRPVLSLSVRGSTDVELGTGWPWLVDAKVMHPAAFGADAPVTFALPGDSAFSLELADAAGRAPAVSFERLHTPLGVLTLDASSELHLRWRLSPAEAAKLSPGRYALRLRLDAPGVSTVSPPVEVRVSASPDAGSFSARLVLADDAAARGDLAGAEAELNAILQQKPDHLHALTRKAALLEKRGDFEAAYRAYNAAIEAALAAEPNAPEGGPRHLYRRKALVAGRVDGGY